MAYEPRYRSIFMVASIAVALAFMRTIGDVITWMRQPFSEAGLDWRPDAHTALALDRLSHATRESTAVDPSPFKAFIERAKLHLRRLGEGWQFGTPTRLMC